MRRSAATPDSAKTRIKAAASAGGRRVVPEREQVVGSGDEAPFRAAGCRCAEDRDRQGHGASAADASAFSLKLRKDGARDWQSLTAADVDDITPMTSYEISP